jgi:hypothetical protein
MASAVSLDGTSYHGRGPLSCSTGPIVSGEGFAFPNLSYRNEVVFGGSGSGGPPGEGAATLSDACTDMWGGDCVGGVYKLFHRDSPGLHHGALGHYEESPS